jgi:AraC-like DNA-binding protein
MPIEIRFDIFSLLILLGVFQGFFIGYFLLRRISRGVKRNIYLGLFVLSLSLTILEILLNYTGLIARVIWLDNFSEPLNFALAPLFYLYIFYGLSPEKKSKVWPHFVIFGLYLLYSLLYQLQPAEFKLNSYLSCYHPDLFPGDYHALFDPDPFLIRKYIYELTLLHFLFYQVLAVRRLYLEYKKRGFKFRLFGKDELSHYRNFELHFVVVILIIVWVKLRFGRDIGDYFIASYAAFLLYLTSFSIVSRSSFFTEAGAEVVVKYQKSSLAGPQKDEIQEKLEALMRDERYFANNLASLSDLANRVGETPHRVSQVINEKYGMNFFNWLASYRIEEAKQILSGTDRKKYKIEELAEMVGYNSKATFNKAFKNQTGQTPSEFRDSIS